MCKIATGADGTGACMTAAGDTINIAGTRAKSFCLIRADAEPARSGVCPQRRAGMRPARTQNSTIIHAHNSAGRLRMCKRVRPAAHPLRVFHIRRRLGQAIKAPSFRRARVEKNTTFSWLAPARYRAPTPTELAIAPGLPFNEASAATRPRRAFSMISDICASPCYI